MEFTNEFRVPVDVETAFDTLIDLERVAPCLPGAQLEEVDGDTYTGRVKVKVGPVQMTYRGKAEVVEIDRDAKRAAIRASGKETRGAGTATADVVATLAAEGADETKVTVVTDLAVTGKPAQFGRGVMEDVGTRLIDTFAERLEAMVTAGETEEAAAPVPVTGETTEVAAAPGPEAVATGAAAVGAAAAGPRRLEQTPGREDDVLDLVDIAGAATLKRLVPLLAALAAVIGLLWWWRRR